MTEQIKRGWDDPAFLDRLVVLLVNDQKTLTSCGHILASQDFQPVRGTGSGRARWIVAERALEFFQHHHEPIGKLLLADVLDHATDTLGWGAGQIGDLRNYVGHLTKVKAQAPEALVEKVIQFKSNVFKNGALNEMNQLMADGKLSDEKWMEFTKKVLSARNCNNYQTVHYLEGVDQRIARRITGLHRQRIPFTLIDPLDALVSTIGPGQLAMVLAPYKRGKSMFLEWLTVAFARQRLNVLHLTLEDPLDTVEDRLDSIVSAIPTKSLIERPKTLARRFQRFRAMVNSSIEVYDGTKREMTVPDIEHVIEESRNNGFLPNVLITDYDEKILATQRYREKRHEIDEVYRTYQGLCARYHLIGWVAAQTQRETRHLKVLSGDKVAEDIGKMRKVTCGISLGKGEWTDNSIYLWIAAHKNDHMEVGCEIVPDLRRAMIYDDEATRHAAKVHAAEEDN